MLVFPNEAEANELFAYHVELDSPDVYLMFPIDSSFNDPSVNGESLIDFEDPLNIQNNVVYDPETGMYVFSSTVGDSLNYLPPSSMTLEEYMQWQNEQSMQNYWEDRIDEQTEVNRDKPADTPGFKIGGGKRNGPFGSDFVEIRPQGSAELSFGINTSRTDNPVLPVKQRRITTFDFDQKIQMGLTGKIGDLMKIGFNYNTEATFDFENQLKLDYSGEEDDIIQKLEAGNVSMPLNSSLITGSQSLFGIKSELKFGRLTVTTVLSQQKGQKKEIEVSGGAQVSEFEIVADNYEENRHYFLNYYFHDTYDQSNSTLPIVSSGVQIQRLEVWITNRTNDYDETRNILAFTDLGEGDINNMQNQGWSSSGTGGVPDNDANGLYSYLTSTSGIRNYANASNILSSTPNGELQQSVDYEKVQNARLLTQNEYTYNAVLGYISLNQSLNNDEVLAVSYQYTYKGQTYQVGEFSTDGVSGQDALYLKLLKSTVRSPQKKLWDLMMKNVYSLGAYQVDQTNFKLSVWYNNPSTSIDINYIPRDGVDNKLLIQLLDLDRLNQKQDVFADGVFDFIPISESQGKVSNGGTINPRNGRLYFTTIEPFGNTLDKKLENAGISQAVRNTIVFQQLYDSTVTAARQIPELNRYKIKGTYQSSVSSEISLNALNIPQGSVKVTAGGRQLTEGTDYTVDYNLGRVKILNDGILSSGTPVKISLESNSLFSIQTKSLLGTHLDYKISRDANIGATVMRLTEKPLTQKVNIGDEPIANTMLGMDGAFKKEVPLLTKLVDKIPFINTKEKSVVNFSGEVAALIPGHNRAIGKNGNSYIDDFEGSQSAIDIRTFNTWVLSSVPQGQPDLFPEGSLSNDLNYGKNRAKLAWYVIDPLFLNDNNLTPDYIKGSAMQDDHRMRQVLVNEVFPNKQLSTGQLTNIPVFDLAYYPEERGPYNYDINAVPGISAGADLTTGGLNDPASRWAGVMRPLTTNDFEAANVQYIQFWMMDPFSDGVTNSLGEPASNEDSPNTTGGDLYFNLGNISEDILKDGQKAFENGLPTDGVYDPQTLDSTVWGYVPTTQVIVNAFDNDVTTRQYQDVGFDGLSDEQEATFFNQFLADAINSGMDQTALQQLTDDPSSDDYTYFRDDNYDAEQLNILERYKKYNNQDGNSPTSEMSADLNADGYPTSASTLPNVEDINRDNNLTETEAYFQYKVSLKPQNMVVGQNYITDRILATDTKSNKQVYWYQFRIPINEYTKRINGIQDFRAIRFIRMFVKDWQQEVVIRFAKLELIRGEWRNYLGSLLTPGEYIQGEESNTTFNISAVNIENNGDREPIHYVLPDSIQRQVNYQTANLAQLNEQSLVLDVCGLQDGDARAAYRNVSFDVRNYNKIRMFVHGEKKDELDDLADDEITVFVRLGSDFVNNYYEYEMPLKLSPFGNHQPTSVWPEDNKMDIYLDALKQVKVNRDNSNTSILERYTETDPQNATRNITVVGNPNLQKLKTIMIGVRNPKQDDPANQWQPDDGLQKCVEVWVNELRLSDFNEQGGWATIGRVNANLADFADVSLAGNYSTPYFGGIEQSVSERQQEFVYGLDASTTIQLGKFFGDKSGVKVPMYLGYSKNVVKPLYDPLKGDLILEKSPEETLQEWRDRLNNSIDLTERRSLNFTNVRIDKQGKGKPHFWDISNFSLTYSYNELYHRDINTKYDKTVNYLGTVNYGFNNSPKPWEPFKKIKFIRKSKWLRPVKDFNLYFAPKQVAFKSTLNRQYNAYEIRNNYSEEALTLPQYNKNFTWDRDYTLKYDITKSLKFDFTAQNRAFINEPFGKVDYGAFGYDRETAMDTVRNSFSSFGENTTYGHTGNVSFKWPFSKFPLTDWISLTTRYSANYNWTRAPLSLDEIPIIQGTDTVGYSSVGNIIQNSRMVTWNGKLNMTTLYGKVPYFQKIEKKYGRSGGSRSSRRKGPQPNLNKKKKLKDMTVKELEVELKKAEKAKDKKKVEEIKKLIVEAKKKGKKKKKDGDGFKPLEQATRILLSLKSVTVNYNTNDGILLPGYAQATNMLGMDNAFAGPSWQFVAGGFQETDLFGRPTNLNFARYAYSQNWLVDTVGLNIINTQYTVNHNEKLTIKATLKPITGLRIDLNADKNFVENTNSTLGWDYLTDDFALQSQKFTGSMSMSMITWRTAFVRDKGGADALTNSTFDNLRDLRTEVSTILGNENPNSSGLANETGYTGGYGSSQQDVIIGAFLTAYTGRNPNKRNINPFKQMPLPNWRIAYDGLSKIKFIKKFVRNITFNHAYRSSFNIGNYTTNLDGEFDADGYAMQTDMSGNLIARKQILTMSIMEQFSPLLGVDLTLKNNLTAKFELKKDRNMSLSLTNNQITEIKGTEIVFGSGYVFKKLQLPIKFGGKQIDPSDLRLTLDVSVRDNKTITRKIIENQNQATAGQKMVSIKFNGSYQLSKFLTVRLYFDRVVNTPFISTSFPTANTSAGFALRFMLQ